MKRESMAGVFLALMVTVSTTVAADAKKLPRLVDLGAKKCIPCKMMAPILDELKTEYAGKLDVEFIDVWEKENADKAKAFGISTIPTQVFMGADGKELWRHEGFISKDGILEKWAELGSELRDLKRVERWKPAKEDARAKDAICHLCDGDIPAKTRVVVDTGKGAVNLCSPHHLFVMLSCLQKGVEAVEQSARVADWADGGMTPLTTAVFLYGIEEKTGRPSVKVFADRKAAEKEMASSGGSIVDYRVLKGRELEARCGFCDRAVYPQDAASVKVGPGLHTWGCCAHCALGVAARTGMDIEVTQPDGLTGEPVVIRTMGGYVAELSPRTATAWFGLRQSSGGRWVSAGCFHQGNFASQENLRKWLDANPVATGKEITIERALMDKMALTPAQIQKACKIGECSPK
jgi:thioredoxin 1